MFSKKNPKSIFISPKLILFDLFRKIMEKDLTFTWFLLGKIC